VCGGETDNDCSTGGRKEQSVVSLGSVRMDPIIITLEVSSCHVTRHGSNELPTEMDGKGVLSLMINQSYRETREWLGGAGILYHSPGGECLCAE